MSPEVDHQEQLGRAHEMIVRLRSFIEDRERARKEPIAIIGIGCRLPGGADSPEEFWRLLRDGDDTVSRFPAERGDAEALFDPAPDTPGRAYCVEGSFIDDAASFDASLFGISPGDAVGMDPQHRMALEVSWEALERAGIPPDNLESSSTGVFLGASTSDYVRMRQQLSDVTDVDPYQLFGEPAFLAGRISYQYGLRGPSHVVDTACSSSLMATHLACRSLRDRECDLALAGGVNLMLTPYGFVLVSKAGAISPDGRCKTFDASANGYGRGEGAVILVLKRLSDAQAAGDNVIAVIRGSAVNHDGRSSGLSVPSGTAQQEVIRAALADAGVTPDRVGYVEAHGTGTVLGDPIELRALEAVMGAGRSVDDPLWVGSVKTNVGHLEAAAGVTGLLKAALVLQHREIPPNQHLTTPNPNIEWDRMHLAVPTEAVDWPSGEDGNCAGVSSFGASGTNVHMVLGSPPARKARPEPDRPHELLLLSGKSEAALRGQAGRWADWLANRDDVPFRSLCRAAAVGRAHLPHRLAVVAGSPEQLRERLAAFTAHGRPPGLVSGRAAPGRKSRVAFLFPGQGSQYPDMGRGLHETEPVFRAALDRCDEALRPLLERPLLSVLYGDAEAQALLDRTEYTQPALFAVEYALAELWRSWGVQPGAVMGHSVGEFVAACVAGVLAPEDAARLVAARARLMQSLPEPGAMISVPLSEEEASAEAAAVSNLVSVASVNSERDTVLSGAEDAITEIAARLAARNVEAKRLRVSHAFHSPLVEPALAEFRAVAASVEYAVPRLTLISNVTGEPVGLDTLADPDYWCRHARQAVRFRDGMRALADAGFTTFLETGPGRTLLGLGSACLPGDDRAWIASMRRSAADGEQIRAALGELFVRGAPVDTTRLYPEEPSVPVDLPTYAFQRERYWFAERQPIALGEVADGGPRQEPAGGSGGVSGDAELLGLVMETAPEGRAGLVAGHLREVLAGALWTPADEIAPDTDLLGLGMDSLMAMQVVAACKNTFGVTASLPDLFEQPTVSAWAAHIVRLLESEHGLAGAGGAEQSAARADWTDPARLRAEAFLPEEIRPGTPSRETWDDPEEVLLTGATGFVGAHLLHELLRSTRAQVHCLVRCVDEAEGMTRLRRNLEAYLPWQEGDESRISVIPGDLAKPLLGMSEAAFDTLAYRVDAIYHNGATVNFVHTYRQLYAANVGGTQEILRLACRGPLTPVNHVSTFAIWGIPDDLTTHFSETDGLERAGRLVNGYVQSKYVAEHVVLEARERGIPVNVYRLGQVTGDTEAGVCLTNSFTCAVIKGCAEMGTAPYLDMLVEMIPADYAVRALVHISRTTQGFGDSFHLVNPARMSFNDMIGHMRRRGWPIEQIPGEDFVTKLRDDIGNGRDNPLHVLIDTMAHIVRAGEDSMSYGVDELAAALDGSRIVCPPLDGDLLDIYLDWMVRTGFLPTASHMEGSLQ
ncbi:type I polyketide synthase [Streptomyces litchfieldiae]|uniref:Thioester reductase domain-containing protein n=1 Tax=Streptomyces litchfieldiae TaxID=3075543 RepID=A0ABU2N1I4_9ACTN|nr:thioester reductase domain-containing protein [Streptomyces sp. DSM 44938]MDT0346928.1 thioester reductase domain-containing protein [Streptomyces sp. DSM 44938]